MKELGVLNHNEINKNSVMKMHINVQDLAMSH